MSPSLITRRTFAARTSMTLAAHAAAAGRVRAADAPRQPLMAYVGTFSSPLRDTLPTQVDLPPGNGQGIHLFRLHSETGALSAAGIVASGISPSSLVVSRDGSRLYSANETDRTGPEKHGTVSAYAVNPADGQLTLLGSVASGGAGPTHVSLHPSGKFLFVANYFGGTVAVLPIIANGMLGTASDVKTDEGPIGPTRATHAPPGSFAISGHDRTHAHMILPDPTGRFVIHADLGLDRLYVWKFNGEEGKLVPAAVPFVTLPPGDGPRHFHFHPNGRWFYSIQEEGSTVVLFDWNAETGALTPRQTISSLPPGYAGSNFCSEILVSPDGRFVYAGNRLLDSIAIFRVGPDGTLAFVTDEPTRGNYPRSFSFDPSGRFLFCCNQRADNLTTFRVDPESGRLHFTGQFTPVGNPSCITFGGAP
jgi:6-phosphogluconolactonase